MSNKQNVWVIKKQTKLLAPMSAAVRIVIVKRPAWVLVQVM